MPNAPRHYEDATDAITDFVRELETRGFVHITQRLRGHFLREYLDHALAAGKTAVLTSTELMDLGRAEAWLTDAAAGRTRRRNTLNGPNAAAAANSQRVRIQTWNAFADHLRLPTRLDVPPPTNGDYLEPEQAYKLLHTLAVKRPVGANAATSLRTAALAALVATTGHSVPELQRLNLTHIDLHHKPLPQVKLTTGPQALDKQTTDILRRWLNTRAHITNQLDGTDPGYLWIPTKPGPTRNGQTPPKPGLTRAAVRTLHAAHRTLITQLFGTPLRPGALLPH